MFENEYLMDRKLIKEYVLNIFSKRTIISGITLFLIGGILFFIEQEIWIKYIMLICSMIGFFSSIITPIMVTKAFEKSAKRLNNGKIEKTIVVFNENIIMNEGKVHLEFEFSQIVKIAQTKSFIFLDLGNKSGILVLKDGFKKGTKEEFIKFIKEKVNI